MSIYSLTYFDGYYHVEYITQWAWKQDILMKKISLIIAHFTLSFF